MNATHNEVALIMDAINDVRMDVASARADLTDVRKDIGAMDKRINGRIRRLENFRWYITGVSALAVLMLGVLVRFI